MDVWACLLGLLSITQSVGRSGASHFHFAIGATLRGPKVRPRTIDQWPQTATTTLHPRLFLGGPLFYGLD